MERPLPNLKMKPPTEKQIPPLKREAPFQEMIHKKKKPKNRKLQLILEFQ